MDTVDWLDWSGKIAYLFFSLLIGVGVVNQLFENAKKNQWRDVRKSTYRQIIYQLSWIATSFLYDNPLISESDTDYASIDELTGTIINGFIHMSKDNVADVVGAYRGLQEKMRSFIETKNDELNELENGEQWDSFVGFVNYLDDLSSHLSPIKLVLIPRVFMLSGSEKICTALANFDNHQVLYEEEIISHRRRARDDGAKYPIEIAELMDRAAGVYQAICDDLTPDEMAEWRIPDEDQTENQEEPTKEEAKKKGWWQFWR